MLRKCEHLWIWVKYMWQFLVPFLQFLKVWNNVKIKSHKKFFCQGSSQFLLVYLMRGQRSPCQWFSIERLWFCGKYYLVPQHWGRVMQAGHVFAWGLGFLSKTVVCSTGPLRHLGFGQNKGECSGVCQKPLMPWSQGSGHQGVLSQWSWKTFMMTSHGPFLTCYLLCWKTPKKSFAPWPLQVGHTLRHV